jgi:hypothetical protein
MRMLYRLAADLVVIAHFSYVAFVVLGQLAILLGAYCRWGWIRNPWLRWLHLAAISIVVAEALLGIVCPLTTWEGWLRARAGEGSYRGDFVGHWTHELLFYDGPPWVFLSPIQFLACWCSPR